MKDIENFQIEYRNIDQMLDIAKRLTDIGYKLHTPLHELLKQRLDYTYYFFDGSHWVRTLLARSNKEMINYEKFLYIINRNLKKIEQPEIDPYGEEEWGYEEIKENIVLKYKNFIKENLDPKDGQRIIFKDLIEQFGYDECLKYLNLHAKNKRVFYISNEHEIIDNRGKGWVVDNYGKVGYLPHYLIHVTMNNYENGNAAGLIYFDPIVNISGKKIKKIEKPDLDPYGEEDWGYEIDEAKKSENLKLLNFRGMEDLFQSSIIDIMGGYMRDNEREMVINLINRNVKGKKVVFYNTRDGKNTKKERICIGAFWMDNGEEIRDLFQRWDLYLVGTKKDYLVDKRRPIGYYDEQEIKPIILNAELDPYG